MENQKLKYLTINIIQQIEIKCMTIVMIPVKNHSFELINCVYTVVSLYEGNGKRPTISTHTDYANGFVPLLNSRTICLEYISRESMLPSFRPTADDRLPICFYIDCCLHSKHKHTHKTPLSAVCSIHACIEISEHSKTFCVNIVRNAIMPSTHIGWHGTNLS